MDPDLIIDYGRVFKLFSGSAEVSPFHNFYANEQTLLRNCGGRLFVHYNGEDIVKTYWSLRKKAIICDTPERPLEIYGPDAVIFLQMIFSRDVAKLKMGRGFYIISCTHSGGTFMDGILFKLSENRFWFVQPDGDMATWLLAHSEGYDITITDPKSRVLQIQGPNSFQIMHACSDGEIDSNFGYFHSGFFKIGSQEVYVSRTGWTGELGYELYTYGDNTNYQKLWDTLLKTGQVFGLVFSSMQAMNIRRIEAGILDSGSDFDTSITPFEAGLGRFVDLTKPKFISIDALKSKPKQKLLHGFLSPEILPQSGFVITNHERKAVGKVTTGVVSPHLGVGIGYVRFFDSDAWIGKQLRIRSDTGGEGDCQVIELPFYDEKKELPRKITNL